MSDDAAALESLLNQYEPSTNTDIGKLATGRRESAVYCSTVCRRAAAKVKKGFRK